MGQDPGRLAIVERGFHLRARRDTSPLMTIQAESLSVVARLAIGGIGEDIHRVSFDEVGVVEPSGLLRRMAISAHFLGMALRAVHAAAGGQ